ncbi:MAG: AMP-binding protein [Acidimicrobiales bacterium]
MFVVGDALRWNKRRYPHEIALVDESGSSTWGEVADRCWALARGLLEAGVKPGDPVGVLSGNSRFSAETYLGIVAAGAVAVEYNNLWSSRELVHGVESTHARVVLVEKPHIESFGAARDVGLSHVETVIHQGEAYESFLRSGSEPEVAVSPADPNVMIFTGGTTGFSKAVVLTHENVLANCMNMIIDTRMEHADRTLIIAPMFHSGSLLCWFLPHVVLGARSVLLRSFDEDAVAEVTASEGVTNGFLVPNMVRRLLASGNLGGERFATYRRCYVGGATFRMPDKLAVRDALPATDIYYQYGLTEAGPIVSRLLPGEMFREEVDGSIGTEFVLTEVSLRGDDGEPVATGDVGEICVRGPNVMLGYHDRPDATADAIQEGWLKTGDMATQSAEGYLFFHDRKKDMIKSGGENVYSQEVERVLYSHPAVSEAAVIGVVSDEWDEEVRAIVALDEGASLSERDLRSYCRDYLAAYKIPKRIAFVSRQDIPINPSGKIIKSELRDADLW